MTRGDKIADYWNDIQDWSTLVKNPVKDTLDKIFSKYLKKVEDEGYNVRTIVELADMTDSFSYVVYVYDDDENDIGFTIFLQNLHNRNILDFDNIPAFNEEEADNWKPQNDKFDLYMHVDGDETNSLSIDDLKVLANKLLDGLSDSDLVDSMEQFKNLDDEKRNIELFNLTNEDKYLPKTVTDIFVF